MQTTDLLVRRGSGRWHCVLKGLTALALAAQRHHSRATEDEGDINELTAKYLELWETFRRRLQKVETGLWDELLQEYIQELEATHSNGESISASDFSRLIPVAQEGEQIASGERGSSVEKHLD